MSISGLWLIKTVSQSLRIRDILECSEASPLLVRLDFLQKGNRMLVERVQTQITSAVIVEDILNPHLDRKMRWFNVPRKCFLTFKTRKEG